MSKLLTIVQDKRLKELEATIESTAGAFVQCGTALAEIRDSKLYLKTHESFEKYCEDKWGYHKSYAYRLIDSAFAVSSLETSPIGDAIKNESQARVLIKIPKKKRAAVVRRAAKSGVVTAKSLTTAAEEIAQSDNAKNGEKEVVRDDTGYIVPPRALPFWKRKGEVEELLGHISKARSALKKVDADNDPMFVETNINQVIGKLNDAYTSLEVSRPYCVCYSCQGQTPKSCTLCKGRGVISKFRSRTVPEEIRAIRAQSCKK